MTWQGVELRDNSPKRDERLKTILSASALYYYNLGKLQSEFVEDDDTITEAIEDIKELFKP